MTNQDEVTTAGRGWTRFRARLDHEPSVPFTHSPGLDGLRAVGILSVIVGHYVAGLFVTGTQQVFGLSLAIDMFFALSGYLITSLLLEEWSRRGSINLRNFYTRRGLRLLPALYAMLAVLVLVALTTGWFERKLTVIEAGAAALYVYPIILVLRPTRALMVHLWTLSIEEWFYFVWPALLLIIGMRPGSSRRFRNLVVGLMVLCVGAFLTRALGLRDPLSLLLATMRPDSLVGGSLLAIAVRYVREFPGGAFETWLRRAAAVGAVGYVYFSLIARFPKPAGMSDKEFHLASFQSWNYRFGMVCAVLLVAQVALVPDGWFGRICAWKPLVHIGVLSYGLYLWHQPLFLLVNGQFFLNADPTVRGHQVLSVPVKVAVAFGIAAVAYGAARLSRRFVELPALAQKHRFEVVHFEGKR